MFNISRENVIRGLQEHKARTIQGTLEGKGHPAPLYITRDDASDDWYSPITVKDGNGKRVKGPWEKQGDWHDYVLQMFRFSVHEDEINFLKERVAKLEKLLAETPTL